jgi:hypothetical protein
VRHVKAYGFEVELDPSAFLLSPQGEPPTGKDVAKLLAAPEPLCRCGHGKVGDHNPQGECLQGCSDRLCRGTAPVEPD